MRRTCLLFLVIALFCACVSSAAGAGTGSGALLAGDRWLAGSDRALLAYGRRLLTDPDAAPLPVGRGILAYGRRLSSVELGTTQDPNALAAEREALPSAPGRKLQGSQREVLAYGRKLQGADRELLAYYGRKLQGTDRGLLAYYG